MDKGGHFWQRLLWVFVVDCAQPRARDVHHRSVHRRLVIGPLYFGTIAVVLTVGTALCQCRQDSMGGRNDR